MASGDTLCVFTPLGAEFPAANYATLDTRNNHPVLDFDETIGETAYFTDIMPQHYSNATGVTVFIHHAATSAVTGTIGWLIAFERMGDGGTDLDADSFAASQTVTAETVDAAAGVMDVASVAVTAGANMDSVVAGDTFRVSLTRDVAVDTAAGDAELIAIEIRET